MRLDRDGSIDRVCAVICQRSNWLTLFRHLRKLTVRPRAIIRDCLAAVELKYELVTVPIQLLFLCSTKSRVVNGLSPVVFAYRSCGIAPPICAKCVSIRSLFTGFYPEADYTASGINYHLGFFAISVTFLVAQNTIFTNPWITK